MKTFTTKKSQRGISIIEFQLLIGIMLMVAIASIIMYDSYSNERDIKNVHTAISPIQDAMSKFYMTNARLPNNVQELGEISIIEDKDILAKIEDITYHNDATLLVTLKSDNNFQSVFTFVPKFRGENQLIAKSSPIEWKCYVNSASYNKEGCAFTD